MLTKAIKTFIQLNFVLMTEMTWGFQELSYTVGWRCKVLNSTDIGSRYVSEFGKL